MIELARIDLTDRAIAEEVLHLQRKAYRIEADLIGSDAIPPLQETLDELQTCTETFLAAIDDGEIIGAISWRFIDGKLDIHRLVVRPDPWGALIRSPCKSAYRQVPESVHPTGLPA